MSLFGCSLIKIGGAGGGGGSETDWSKRRAAKYSGPACNDVLYSLDELGGYDYNSQPTTTDNSARAQILLAVCRRGEKKGYSGHTVPQHPRIKQLRPEEVYKAQDDRHLDVVAVAITAVQIANEDRRHNRRDYLARRQGLALTWHAIVSKEMLEAGLQKVDVAPEAKAAFVKQYLAIPQSFSEPLSNIGKRLLVDIPVATFRDRAEHYAAHQAEYAELDELAARAKNARANGGEGGEAVIKELRALRRKFASKCKVACLSRPLFAETTRELALLHVIRREVLDARAESRVFLKGGSYTAGFAQAVRVAQAAERLRLEQAKRAYDKARKAGNDETTAVQLAGGTKGARVDTRLLIDVKMELPNFAAAITKRKRRHASNQLVASVSRSGATARVTFKKNRYKTSEAYNCKRTNRIERISRDGRIQYERNCKYRDKTVVSESHKPITLPASEAKAIRSGDILTFIQGKEGARTVELRRDKALVQVRDARLR